MREFIESEPFRRACLVLLAGFLVQGSVASTVAQDVSLGIDFVSDCTEATCDRGAGCRDVPVPDGLPCTIGIVCVKAPCPSMGVCRKGKCVRTASVSVEWVPQRPGRLRVHIVRGEPRSKAIVQGFANLPLPEERAMAARTAAAAGTDRCARRIARTRVRLARKNSTEVAVTNRKLGKIKHRPLGLWLRFNTLGRCLLEDAADHLEPFLVNIRAALRPPGSGTILAGRSIEIIKKRPGS